jgi:glutamine amidotransferase
MKNIVIIDYGAGNLFSVKAAFERLGVNPVCSNDKKVIENADLVIFPGVGHAKTAMEQLKASGLITLIKGLKQPVLGVCLGMQLMCTHTEEGDVEGLGIFDVPVKLFKDVPKIPHMGWNNLLESKGFLKDISQDVYFVHSYYVPLNKYTIATCHYGADFSAALKKDNFYACQFHPEKSGEIGQQILKRFLEL